jgi:uncharacterized membrane protein YdjX (TVP38/TMEM64 family)
VRPVLRSRLAAVCIALPVLSGCAGRGPSVEGVNDSVSLLEQHSEWAWAVGIGLIVADLVLPIPQTAVIAALGIIYGPVLGGLLGTAGLVAAGGVAFGLMKTSGRRLVLRVIGHRSMEKIGALSEHAMPWGIALTRSLPYSVPEAVACVAGLSNIRRSTFFAALTLGSVPIAIGFAALGAGWSDRPALALGVSYALPIVLLPPTLLALRRLTATPGTGHASHTAE